MHFIWVYLDMFVESDGAASCLRLHVQEFCKGTVDDGKPKPCRK